MYFVLFKENKGLQRIGSAFLTALGRKSIDIVPSFIDIYGL